MDQRDQLKSLAEYIGVLAGHMKLVDWEIRLSGEPPDDHRHMAAIQIHIGQRRATVYFSEAFWDADLADQKQTIVHELTHCHVDPMIQSLFSVEDLLGTSTFHVFHKQFRERMEQAVDAIATAWSQSLPDRTQDVATDA